MQEKFREKKMLFDIKCDINPGLDRHAACQHNIIVKHTNKKKKKKVSHSQRRPA